MINHGKIIKPATLSMSFADVNSDIIVISCDINIILLYIYFIIFHYISLYFIIFHYIILYYIILYYTILYYITLYYIILYYFILYILYQCCLLGSVVFFSTPTGRRVTLGPGGDARPSAASSGMPGTPSGNFTWRTCSVRENHRKTIGTWENHRKTIGKWRFTLW